MRLLKQLVITFSIILVVNLVTGVYFTKKISDLKTLVEVMYDNSLMASTFAMSAKYRFERADSMVRTAFLFRDPEKFKELTKEIESQLEQGEEDLAVVQERAVAESSKEIAESVQSKVSEYRVVVNRTLSEIETKNKSTRDYKSMQIDVEKYLAENVRNLIQKKLTDLTDDAAETGYTFRLDSEARNKETVRFFYIGSLAIVLITLILAFFLSRTIAKPLARYSKICLEISSGNYKKRVAVYGEQSEIAVLGKSFNQMLDRVDEKDRSMKSLLDGLTTAVFSFNSKGEISPEKSIACAQVFAGQKLDTIFSFFTANSNINESGTREALGLLWDSNLKIDFDSLVTGVFPASMTLPCGAAQPEKFISLRYRRNVNSEDQLEQVIVLAEDITESTVAQKNSVLQAERVDRLTKASQSAENYIESKNNFIIFIKRSKTILEKGFSAITAAEMIELKRELHSLKGELALMGHKSCASQVHDVETRLADPADVKAETLVTCIQKIESEFVDESKDVLEVLGLNEQSKMVKVSEEKIQGILNYVKGETLFSSEQKNSLLSRLTGLLQKPLRHFFQKYETYVRETAGGLGKTVELQFDANSDEVTYNEVQHLDAVFGHLLRNSLDHGIEEMEIREESGKALIGLIKISATRDLTQKKLRIVVSDDGRGIDPKRLIAKAVQKNIWTVEKGAQATTKEALDLIFLSDFSLKEVVTETSGRGVGMDAVRSEVEKLGGTIDLKTEINKGTQFVIVLPS